MGPGGRGRGIEEVGDLGGKLKVTIAPDPVLLTLYVLQYPLFFLIIREENIYYWLFKWPKLSI